MFIEVVNLLLTPLNRLYHKYGNIKYLLINWAVSPACHSN